MALGVRTQHESRGTFVKTSNRNACEGQATKFSGLEPRCRGPRVEDLIHAAIGDEDVEEVLERC